MASRPLALLTAALLLGACDPGDPAMGDGSGNVGDGGTDGGDPSTDDGDDPPPSDGMVDTSDGVAAGHQLASLLTAEAQTSASITTEAVFMASQAAGTGQVVASGTLTRQGQSFSWSPEPSDRLVVALGDGTTISLWVEQFAGDTTSPSAFLSTDHQLTYVATVDDRVDMRLSSLRQGGTMNASATGKYTHEGVAYDVDLQLAGTTYFESDSTGTHNLDEHRTTGTIKATGFDLDVDEDWRFELVVAGNESAQSTHRTIRNSLRLGETTFDWVDVLVQKSFRDGVPSELDTYWLARGQVLRNGEPYGAYRLDPSATLESVAVVLDTPDGAIEIDRDRT